MLRIRSFHALWLHFPEHSAHNLSCHGVVLQPRRCPRTSAVWALPRSLATTQGIIVYFLFLGVLRCFSSPRMPTDITVCQAFNLAGCPIRRSTGQGSFAPHRGLSQLITSFIASKSQGIHRTPLYTFFCRSPCYGRRSIYFRLYINNVSFSTLICFSQYVKDRFAKKGDRGE